MTGKGWTWIGTDGATTSTFVNSPNLQLAMQGMVGTRPKNGEGALYQKLLKTWKEKDADLFPGLIHSPRVLQVSLQYIFVVFALLLSFFCLRLSVQGGVPNMGKFSFEKSIKHCCVYLGHLKLKKQKL